MLILSCILGGILVIIWLSLIDMHQILALIKLIKPMWLLIASVFCTGRWFTRSIRWKVILDPISKISIIKAFNLYMAGTFINFIIPVKAGELTKSVFLKKLNMTPISKSLPTIFIDKVLDLSAIALILSIIPFVRGYLSKTIYTILVSLLLIFTLSLFVIIISTIRADFVVIIMRKCFFWLPLVIKDRIMIFLELFVEGMSVIRTMPKKIGLIVAYVLIAIAFDCFYVWGFFYAFGLKLPWSVALFCSALIPLFYVLPSPPAGIGSHELIYILLFSVTFGYDRNISSAVALSAHLLALFLLGVFGIIALGSFGLGFSTVFGRRQKFEEFGG